MKKVLVGGLGIGPQRLGEKRQFGFSVWLFRIHYDRLEIERRSKDAD